MQASTPNTMPPTQVADNYKCRGCEHFQSQLGTAGMCDVGTYPQHCGDGSDPEHGYRPLAGGMVDVGVMSSPASPGDTVPEDRVTIPFQVIELSKSLALQAKRDCALHRTGRDNGMVLAIGAPIVTEMCCCPKGAELAKMIRKGLPPQFQRLSDEAILKVLK